MERLDKRLADTGRWSRKEAGLMIRRGRITVDGVIVSRPEEKVPVCAAVRVDGEVLPGAGFTYLMMNKPGGVLSATTDKRQKTVLDLLPAPLRRLGLFPVGRLDKDAEGLLLLTNDGALAHKLLAPKSGVDKVYHVAIDGSVDADDVKAFAAGLALPGGLVCRPAGLRPLGAGEALVTLHEGRFHQVKRMLAARGKPVRSLKRLSMGRLMLDAQLAQGAFRPLTEQELDDLNSAF